MTGFVMNLTPIGDLHILDDFWQMIMAVCDTCSRADTRHAHQPPANLRTARQLLELLIQATI